MSRRSVSRCTAFTALLLATFAAPASAQDASAPAQQLPRTLLTAMSAEEQMRLALTAAPSEVTRDASIYVLSGGRYVKKTTGSNGFSCLVERELLETIEPVCYDVEGGATTMQARFRREELRAQGLSEDVVRTRIAADYKRRRLHAPRKPGVIYMLSAEQWSFNPVTKVIWHSPPHFMLHAPYARQSDMGGAPGPQIPFIIWPGQPDALMIIMAPGEHGH